MQRSLPTIVVAVSRDHLELIQSRPTLAEPLAPNFAGVKYTGMYTYPGMVDAQRIMNYKEGKFEVLSGREEMMLEALSIGIKGHVGSQFNFAGDLYNGIRSTFAREGLTDKSQAALRGMQTQAVSLIDAWKNPAPVGVNGAKYFMNLAGKRSARRPSRVFISLATRAPIPQGHPSPYLSPSPSHPRSNRYPSGRCAAAESAGAVGCRQGAPRHPRHFLRP